MNTDNIDRFGHCVACHKNLITKKVVDGQVIDMFLPIHDHTEFLLDNGSKMQVCICKPCKQTLDLNCPHKHKDFMEAVQKGWELEVKALIADESYPDWTEESGKRYLDKMSLLNIDCHIENKNKESINTRIKELVSAK